MIALEERFEPAAALCGFCFMQAGCSHSMTLPSGYPMATVSVTKAASSLPPALVDVADDESIHSQIASIPRQTQASSKEESSASHLKETFSSGINPSRCDQGHIRASSWAQGLVHEPGAYASCSCILPSNPAITAAVSPVARFCKD